jgi:hypothetical protein
VGCSATLSPRSLRKAIPNRVPACATPNWVMTTPEVRDH